MFKVIDLKQANPVTTADKPNQKGSGEGRSNKQPNKTIKSLSGGGNDNSDKRKKTMTTTKILKAPQLRKRIID